MREAVIGSLIVDCILSRKLILLIGIEVLGVIFINTDTDTDSNSIL